MKDKITLENTFLASLILMLCVLVFGGLNILLFEDKPVIGYYLTSHSSGALEIGVDIDNSDDGNIPLHGVSYQEAIDLINQLNEGLYSKDE